MSCEGTQQCHNVCGLHAWDPCTYMYSMARSVSPTMVYCRGSFWQGQRNKINKNMYMYIDTVYTVTLDSLAVVMGVGVAVLPSVHLYRSMVGVLNSISKLFL